MDGLAFTVSVKNVGDHTQPQMVGLIVFSGANKSSSLKMERLWELTNDPLLHLGQQREAGGDEGKAMQDCCQGKDEFRAG